MAQLWLSGNELVDTAPIERKLASHTQTMRHLAAHDTAEGAAAPLDTWITTGGTSFRACSAYLKSVTKIFSRFVIRTNPDEPLKPVR